MNTLTSTAPPIGTIPADQAVATLTLAFVADPVIRWVYPGPPDYLTHFPQLVRLLGHDPLEAGRADGVAGHAGAALWVRPGVEPDSDAIGALLAASIQAERHETLFAFLEQVTDHHPTGTHWYLPFIGVEPTHQGRGYGAALLAAGTARADQDRLACYLEATSPRNRALYERHGFQVTGEIQAGDSPPLWPMIRPAATADGRMR